MLPKPAASGSKAIAWVPVGLVAGVFVVLVRIASEPLGNFDTYFHLRFGHEFLHGWSLNRPGTVSSFATAHWVPTQWLAQITMAEFENWFGLAGVAWLSGVQMIGLATALYFSARRRADRLVVAPLIIIALIACSSGLSMRPQVLSYICVTIVASAWLRTTEDLRARWWLVPMAWLWAMLHGMWPVGLVIGVAAITGLALDGRIRGRVLGRLALIPLSAALAAGLTPVGPALYPAVFEVNSRRAYFSEWAPPTFTDPGPVCALVLLAGTVVIMLRSGQRVQWTQLVMLLMAGGWAVYSQRTVPVSACISLPLAAQAFQSLLDRPRLPMRRHEGLALLAGAVASLTALAAIAPHTAAQPPHRPAWVDPTLSALPAETRVIDDSSFGGFLMWRYPQLDLVDSGYGDMFTDAEMRRNEDLRTLQPGWTRIVRDSRATYAVLSPDDRLAHALTQFMGWTVVRRSHSVELLQAPPG